MGIMEDLKDASIVKVLATATGGGSSSTYTANMREALDCAMVVLVASQPSSGTVIDIDDATSRGGSFSNLTTLTTGQTTLSSDASVGDTVLSVAAVTNFSTGDIVEIDDSNSGNTEQAEIEFVDSDNNEITLNKKLNQAFTSTYGSVYTAVKREKISSYDKFIKADSLTANDVACAGFIIAGKERT